MGRRPSTVPRGLRGRRASRRPLEMRRLRPGALVRPRSSRATGLGPLVPVAAGLVLQASTTYLFLILAGRAFGPEGFAALSGLYLLLTSLATGLFVPLEQEIARRRGEERARGRWDDRLPRRALGYAAVVTLVTCGLLLLASSLVVGLLGGDRALLAPLCVGLAGYGCWFAVRGELSGRGLLLRYGVQTGLEGLSRLVLAIVLTSTGLASAASFGWLLALAPWWVVLATMPTVPRVRHPAAHRGPALVGPVLLLSASALAAQLVINVGPLAIGLLASPDERSRAGAYLAALVVLRIPVFLLAAVQPSLLPRLSGLAARGELEEFSRDVKRVIWLATAVMAVVGISATAAGPGLLSALFGFEERLTPSVFALLACAVWLFLLGTILAQALLAHGAHGQVTSGWLAGLLALTLALGIGGDLVVRTTVGLVAGAAVATIVIAVLLRRCHQGRGDGAGRRLG